MDSYAVFAILLLAILGIVLFWVLAKLEAWALPWHASQKDYTPTA